MGMEDDHMALWRSENDDSDSDWLYWIAKVEALVGHDLDGSQTEDGYSLDTAYEMYEAGLTALQAASIVRVSEKHSH